MTDSAAALPGRWFLSTKRILLSHIFPTPILKFYGSYWEQLLFLLIFPNTLPLCPFDRLLFIYVFPDYSTPCLRISAPHKVLKTTFFDDFFITPSIFFLIFFRHGQFGICARCTGFLPESCKPSTAM